jgi:hypothetical protein
MLSILDIESRDKSARQDTQAGNTNELTIDPTCSKRKYEVKTAVYLSAYMIEGEENLSDTEIDIGLKRNHANLLQPRITESMQDQLTLERF